MRAETGVLACPHCSGAVRAAARWCTQCFQALPGGEQAAAPAATPVPAPAAPATAGPDTTAPDRPGTWPCSRCGAANGLDEVDCSGCGLPFLAALRAAAEGEGPLLALPVVGDLSRLGRGGLVVLGLLLAGVLVLLTALGGVLLG